ncbi:MAG: hypothetical protein LBT55_00380 [Clostridiaceae bacterium]|jgi:ABC-type transport system involved in multi-copper enzyme maturation permease subunit|nr:hypothetical protein [Clostridiaceae bacterium]
MKNEVLKLVRNKAFFALLLLTVLFSFTLSFIYYFSQNDIYGFEGIIEYDNKEELHQAIADNEVMAENLFESFMAGEISEEDYEIQSEALQINLRIYRHLDENNFAYEDVQPATEFNTFSDNKISFVRLFSTMFELLMFPIAMMLAALIFNYEIGRGIHKFIYNRGRKRLKIVFKKSVVYFSSVALFLLIGISLMFIMSIPFGLNFKYLLIVTAEGAVKTYTTSQYTAQVVLALISEVLVWSIIFFALSLLIKNTYVLLATGIVCSFGLQMLLAYIPNNFIKALVQFPVFIHDIGITLLQFSIAITIKYLAAIALTVVSLIRFSRKDLA